MKEILDQLLQTFLIALIPVLTPYLIKLIQKLVALLDARLDAEIANTANEKERSAREKEKHFLESSITAATTAITEVNQTYVDSVKSAGKFDEAAQKEALERAKASALSYMTDDAKEFIKNSYGDLEKFITGKIEEAVKRHKMAGGDPSV
jgi:indole-3-glycerol phosphate synthase